MRFLLDLAWRDLRAGGRPLWVFAACLMLGVALVAAGGGLYRQVQASMLADVRALFGGDLEVRQHQPLPDEALAWMAGRGEVSRLVELRTMLRKPDYGKRVRAWEYCLSGSGTIDLEASINPRATGQKRLLRALADGNTLDSVQARLIYPGAPRLLRHWIDKGWVEKHAARARASLAKPVQPFTPTPQRILSAEQRQAIVAISDTLGHYVPWLLHGVTGSGKTEVYLSLIEHVAAMGKQTLLLVPEINLTPQLEALVQGRFPSLELVSLHSGLAEGERLARWEKARTGQAFIVLGTRLAVFTPLPQIGLVIVDEEHDSSFKQTDGLRYHARDLAVYIAKCADVPVVLGSATPSLETYANMLEGRYHGASLTLRPSAQPPTVEFVDVREKSLEHGLSEAALAAISLCVSRGEQSLVYINRRGFAPVLLCRACGWMAQCQRCSARLTLHSRSSKLKCHYCGHEERVSSACPECGNPTVIKKDGCDFCTACGYVGQCG